MSADPVLNLPSHDLTDEDRPKILVGGNYHRMGRKPPRETKKVLRLDYYFDGAALAEFAASLPDVMDFTQFADSSIKRMYKNDALGDCVIASKYHKIGMMSSLDAKDPSKCRVGDDTEVVSQYRRICGAGDNGCVITDVLDDMVAGRFKVGGAVAQLDGYCFVDPTNWDLTKVSHYLFGPHDLGLNLPSAWEGDNDVWDVTTTRSVGGHDVQTGIFDANKGITIASWGRLYLITKAAYTHGKKWVEESYAGVAKDWYGVDKTSPTGLMADELQKDLDLVKQGKIPEINPAAFHTWADAV